MVICVIISSSQKSLKYLSKLLLLSKKENSKKSENEMS